MTEVEEQIRKAHLINWALFVLKIVEEKIPKDELNLLLYLQGTYNGLIEIKDEMKETFKKYNIKLLAPDEDLRAVFNEAESLAKSSFSYRALGFIAAAYPSYCKIDHLLQFTKSLPKDDIIFSYQQFKYLLETNE
jgi:hypothetical protein